MTSEREKMLEDENRELRRMLFNIQWQPQDYTDDSELQSQAGKPFTDFKRHPVSALKEAVEIRRKEQQKNRETALKEVEDDRDANRFTLLSVMKELGISMTVLRSDIPKEVAKRHQKIESLKQDLRVAYAALQGAAKALSSEDLEEVRKLLADSNAQEYAHQIVKRMEQAELRVISWRVWVSNVIGFDHVTTSQTDQQMRDSIDKQDKEATEKINEVRTQLHTVRDFLVKLVAMTTEGQQDMDVWQMLVTARDEAKDIVAQIDMSMRYRGSQ